MSVDAPVLSRSRQKRSSVTHLRRLRLLLLHFSPDETVQHRLEEVDHQLDLPLLLVPRQVDHLVLVALHQTFVADGGFLVGAQEGKEGGEMVASVGLSYVPAAGLTGREYMALMVSLNSMVAVTKMDSVADSDCPLVRKSLTYKKKEEK